MSWGNKATLMSAAGVPLWMSGSILYQARWQLVVVKLDMEGCIPITYCQWSCWHDSVPWVVMVVIQSTIWWHLWAGDIYPSTKHMQSCRHPLPMHVTWSLHPSSMDTLVDIHGRSCSFPLIHPREVFLAWCWVIARTLSSRVFLLSLPLGVGLTGVELGTSVPCLADSHTQGNASFWNDKEKSVAV